MLERFATGPLPGGLDASPARTEFWRDVYFDTLAGELEERGVTVRLRIHSSGDRTLSVDVLEREAGGAAGRHAEAGVPHAEPREILAGDSEPGTGHSGRRPCRATLRRRRSDS